MPANSGSGCPVRRIERCGNIGSGIRSLTGAGADAGSAGADRISDGALASGWLDLVSIHVMPAIVSAAIPTTRNLGNAPDGMTFRPIAPPRPGPRPRAKRKECFEQTLRRGLLALPSPRPGQGQQRSRIALAQLAGLTTSVDSCGARLKFVKHVLRRTAR